MYTWCVRAKRKGGGKGGVTPTHRFRFVSSYFRCPTCILSLCPCFHLSLPFRFSVSHHISPFPPFHKYSIKSRIKSRQRTRRCLFDCLSIPCRDEDLREWRADLLARRFLRPHYTRTMVFKRFIYYAAAARARTTTTTTTKNSTSKQDERQHKEKKKRKKGMYKGVYLCLGEGMRRGE